MNLIYFDHNILDRMLKGSEDAVTSYIHDNDLVPVWSDENIQEILKSKGHEDHFCNLLSRIRARRVSVKMNNFQSTNQFIVEEANPKERLEELAKTVDIDMAGFLEKAFGGRAGESFTQALLGPLADVESLLSDLVANAPDQHSKEKAKIELAKLSELYEGPTQMGSELDQNAAEGTLVDQLAAHTGISPKQLNNIKPPNVVEQVWEKFRTNPNNKPVFPNGTSLEQFFGLAPHIDTETAPLTTTEKINSIYHHLNFVGYQRDSQMYKPALFHASLNDMTHAGLACCAAVFLCNDVSMRLKAQAAYEFLGIATVITSLDRESGTVFGH